MIFIEKINIFFNQKLISSFLIFILFLVENKMNFDDKIRKTIRKTIIWVNSQNVVSLKQSNILKAYIWIQFGKEFSKSFPKWIKLAIKKWDETEPKTIRRTENQHIHVTYERKNTKPKACVCCVNRQIFK